MLNQTEKSTLAAIVSHALRSAISGGSYQPQSTEFPALNQECGCFVTYKTHGELRGCIGCFTSSKPLYQTIAEYAVASATEDPRFAGNRLTTADLPQVMADVSVLSPLEKCDNPWGIKLGTHGIYLRKGFQSGCFLPQVADETGWSVEEFWSYCCSHKAGLPSDCWKQPGVDLFTFTAEVFEFSCKEENPSLT